jgi:hypothetical protein
MFNDIADVARLPSGHIVLADETLELRVFDSTGKHVASYGGKGQGPGEFMSISDIVAEGGDTLLVWDPHVMRYSTFSVAEGLVDRASIRRKSLSDLLVREYYYEHMYPASDGSLIVAVERREGYSERVESRPAGVFSRMPSTLVWVDPGFTSYRLLGEHGGIQQVKVVVAGRPTYFIAPNGFWPHQSVGGNPPRICIDALSGPQVNCYDADGRAIQMRWHMEVPRLTAELAANWIESEASRGPSRNRHSPEQIRAALSGVTPPSEMASIHALHVDALGMVWVSSPDMRLSESGLSRYRVFGIEGELLGYAEVPALQVREIGESHLITIGRNSNGVEHVEVHKLSRQPVRR